MSFIQKLFTSRDNNANSATYVGEQDRLWWDPVTNQFYYSDGNTAGGFPAVVVATLCQLAATHRYNSTTTAVLVQAQI